MAVYKPPRTLRRRADFLRVQGQGKKLRGRHVLVFVLPNPQQPAEVGYTVSRKVGNAVVRNRVRRRLRELVRLHPEWQWPDTQCVLVATPSASTASYASLQRDLTQILGRRPSPALAV